MTQKSAQSIRTGKIPERTAENHFITSSLWLSNNLLISLTGLDNLVKSHLGNFNNLSWLDMSFNKIKSIENHLNGFVNLKILYLHGNNIVDINQVVNLRILKNLKSLTLHGNPIENVSCYRGFVIQILPQISSLDFSPILSQERKKALPVGFFKTIKTH